MESNELLGVALNKRRDGVFFEVSRLPAEANPDRCVIETEESNFKLYEFAWSKACTVRPKADVYSQHETEHHLSRRSWWQSDTNAWNLVEWNNHSLEVVTVTIQGNHCPILRHYIVAETKEIARAFFLACCNWNAEVRGEVLVFSGGWYKDE